MRAPVIGRAPTVADFRPFAGAPDRFNFAPFNFQQIPLERYGGFVTLVQELGENANLTLRVPKGARLIVDTLYPPL